jgi:nucleotide-binding universal stress UspA family protein
MYSESEVADMFTTMVAGVDGLEGGRDALVLAQRIADLPGGELVAVHVHPYATGEAVVGVARDELVRLSECVDLLVLGSRGYGPVRRTLLGGSSDRIVHAAVCPVIVVPRDVHEGPADEHSATAELTAG